MQYIRFSIDFNVSREPKNENKSYIIWRIAKNCAQFWIQVNEAQILIFEKWSYLC